MEDIAHEHRYVPEEHVFMVGGYTTDYTKHENIVTLDYQPRPSIVARAPLCADSEYHCVCCARDGLIISGGKNLSTRESISKVQKFCVKMKKWTDLPNMLQGRRHHGSACVDDKLYILGGLYAGKGSVEYKNTVWALHLNKEKNNTQEYKDSGEPLDSQSRHWTTCKEMPQAVEKAGIAVVRNYILTLGGYLAAGGFTTRVEKYDANTGQWEECQPMPLPTDSYRSTATDGNVVFALAYNMRGFLRYDLERDQWTALNMPIKRASCGAFVAKQGCLMALGGCSRSTKDYVQTYNPVSDIWKLEEHKLPLPLEQHWAVILTF